MEQTAVEWFAERISHGGLVSKKQFNELLKQANEVFEQQIIDASNESYLNSELIKRSVKNKKVFSVGEQYYNETFKQQEQ
jgi:hypothetical protein